MLISWSTVWYDPSRLFLLSILTWENNDFKPKIMESLIIAQDKPVLNKADSSLPLELFWYKISGYHMMFYHIIWCLSVSLYIYHCALFVQFSILCYEFCVLSKTMYEHLYHFRCDHESSGFRKLAVNSWICQKNCHYFLD